MTQWLDRVVYTLRQRKGTRTWGRPLADWTALLHRLGFSVRALPMSQGTLFANVLLVCDLQIHTPATAEAHRRAATP